MLTHIVSTKYFGQSTTFRRRIYFFQELCRSIPVLPLFFKIEIIYAIRTVLPTENNIFFAENWSQIFERCFSYSFSGVSSQVFFSRQSSQYFRGNWTFTIVVTSHFWPSRSCLGCFLAFLLQWSPLFCIIDYKANLHFHRSFHSTVLVVLLQLKLIRWFHLQNEGLSHSCHPCEHLLGHAPLSFGLKSPKNERNDVWRTFRFEFWQILF